MRTQKSATKHRACEKLDKKNLPTTIEVKMFVDANSPVGYIYGKGNTFYLFLDINFFCRLYYDSRP